MTAADRSDVSRQLWGPVRERSGIGHTAIPVEPEVFEESATF